MTLQDLQATTQWSSGQVWLASRLLYRQIVNAATLEPLGRVADVVLDPERCQIAALAVQPDTAMRGVTETARRLLRRGPSIASIGLEYIVALSGDVVVVDIDPARLASSRRMDRMPHLRDICELTIITLHGMCLGSLADVLLDSRGSTIAGYVVSPTRLGESLLMPAEELEPPATQRMDVVEVGTPDPPPPSEPSLADLRIIPASSRVRIGTSLMLVYEDAEPLRPETVVITSHADHVET
jgi:sporulation protein YlmC with PRC-barrel domain